MEHNFELEALNSARRRWRRTVFVLNATRRFRYARETIEEIEIERRRLRIQFRKTGHALIAMHRFRQAGETARLSRLEAEEVFSTMPPLEDMVSLNENASAEELAALGGGHGLAKLLNVDPETGLSGEEPDLELRRKLYGTNKYPEKTPKPFLAFLWEACQDTTLIILMGCAFISLVAGMVNHPADGWYEGVGIGAAVLVVILVTAISDYRQSIQFRYLSAENANIKLQAVRGGRRLTLSIYELAVGDVVPLSIGDQVPADGVVLVSHSLSVDESSMTGESLPRTKDSHYDPFLLSGCKVADGFGSFLVTGVGLNTEWGRVMSAISTDTVSETPLQARLSRVATLVAKIGLTVAVLLFGVLITRYFASYEPRPLSEVVSDIVKILSLTVTIIVVAVPEGLPLAVTLTLAYSMKKMMADKALVRQLAACETMGSATTICSDKTGTLTLNQMVVVRSWVGGREWGEEAGGPPGADAESEGGQREGLHSAVQRVLLEGLALNTAGSVYASKVADELPQVTASPTEAALLHWGIQLGMDFSGLRREWEIVQVETFNSAKKRAGVLVKRREALEGGAQGPVMVHWKGAAEIVLESCSHWLNAEGQQVAMDDATRTQLGEVIARLASQSLRCIAVAHSSLPPSALPQPDLQNAVPPAIPGEQLTLTAIAGLKDPCRPGVAEAVMRCQLAGVKVRMVTGDNLLTARSIASECGILSPGGITLEGPVWRAMSDEERRDVLPRLDVLARSSPTDKLTLVQALRAAGEVVAVTGDGTNDAPALHEADIGLSMGICGTEVAKESSDIIILDDDFTSIVKVVRWGRSVYASVQKFIQFQLTVNVVALVTNFVAACTDGDVPLTAVQLLWVNLIMDTLGALALATDNPTDDLLKQPPVGRTLPLITNIMWRNLGFMAMFQLTIFLTLNYRGLEILNLGSGKEAVKVNNTIIFNAFVFSQLFNEVNSRRPEKLNVFEGIHRNPIFLSVVGISALFQVMIVEFLNKFASTTSLSWDHWLFCIIVGSLALPWGAVVKFIPVPSTPLTEFFPKVSFSRCFKGRKNAPSDGEDGQLNRQV